MRPECTSTFRFQTEYRLIQTIQTFCDYYRMKRSPILRWNFYTVTLLDQKFLQGCEIINMPLKVLWINEEINFEKNEHKNPFVCMTLTDMFSFWSYRRFYHWKMYTRWVMPCFGKQFLNFLLSITYRRSINHGKTDQGPHKKSLISDFETSAR